MRRMLPEALILGHGGDEMDGANPGRRGLAGALGKVVFAAVPGMTPG
jgi:hypothetical protein